MRLLILLILCMVWLVGCVDLPPYQNTDLDVEERVGIRIIHRKNWIVKKINGAGKIMNIGMLVLV